MIGTTLEFWHFCAMHVILEGVCASGEVGEEGSDVLTDLEG